MVVCDIEVEDVIPLFKKKSTWDDYRSGHQEHEPSPQRISTQMNINATLLHQGLEEMHALVYKYGWK